MSNNLVIKGSEVYEKNALSKKKIRINRGGTRSTKSYSICQIAVVWLLTGRIGSQFDSKGTFSVVRKFLPSLRSSTLRDFIEILEATGLHHHIDYNKSNFVHCGCFKGIRKMGCKKSNFAH